MPRKPLDWTRVGSFMVKFAYFGADYFGLSAQTEKNSAAYYQAQAKRRKLTPAESDGAAVPTIEAALETAMQKACLIKSLAEAHCSRCGRTDRGVHARGNYLTLLMRLKPGAMAAPQSSSSSSSSEQPPAALADLLEPTANTDHYDYAAILNGLLPPAVRIIWVKACPVWLDARFHCQYRMYRYYFKLYSDTDVSLMNLAARQLLGSHDFRNFCKVDPSAQKTTVRQLFRCEVAPVDASVGVMLMTGPAFLWHQVRCIAGCLMAIGRRQLSQSVLIQWLDVVLTPEKPPYIVAPPDGLVLWDCAYEVLPTAPADLFDLSRVKAAWAGGCQQAGVGSALPADLSPKQNPTAAFREQIADLCIKKAVLECLATADDDSCRFTDI